MKYVVPTFHPSFILRGTRKYMGLLRWDVRRAVALARGWKPEWSDAEFILAPKADEVVRVLRSMRGRRVGWDIETDGQHPLVCDVRCIGFYDGEKGICVPLLYRTGARELGLDGKMHVVWKPYFDGPALVAVLKAVTELLNDEGTTPVAQNGQYDKLCMKARLNLDLRYAEDTMLAHHVVAAYLPHGLGFLATVYTDICYYKASESGDAWSSGSDHELWLYCCRDCKVTWLAWDKLRSEVKERTADSAIYALDKRSAELAERWKHVGMGIDVKQLKRYQVHYDAIAVNSLSKLRESVQHLNGTRGVNEEALEALLKVLGDKLADEDLVVGADGEIVEREDVDVFNPGSLKQLRLALSAFNIPLTELTATGDVSTSKEMLLGARKLLIDQKAKATDPRLAFLDYLFSWRESKKLRSTYLTPEKGAPEIITPQMVAERRVHCLVPYGELPRVHPTFNVHVTPTGRLCIAGWTLVRVAFCGLVPLRRVRVGDFVWTHKQRWRAVKAVLHQGPQEVLDVRLSTGQIVTATTGHRLLGADGQWVTVGELRERVQAVVGEEGEPGRGSDALPQLRATNGAGGSKGSGDNRAQRARGTSTRTVSRGIQSAFAPALLGLKDGCQEPDIRQAGVELEGGMRRWVRLPDHPLPRKAPPSRQRGDVEGIEVEHISQRNSGASHRQRPEEQRTGQPRLDDECRTPSNSLPTSEGQSCCSVEEVVARGSVETYDLTVEEDESFEAAGIFSHNSSSNPNAQNQPAELRAMVVARKDHMLVTGDWDSGELRMQAYASGDDVLMAGFKAYDAGTGLKLHILNASAIFGLPPTKDFEKKYPGPYRASKVFVYACAYGAGPNTVFDKVRDEMPDMQWPDFQRCYKNYKAARPGLFGFLKGVVEQGMQHGYLESQILGRRTYYFEPAMGFGGSSVEASAMQNFNFQAGLAEVVTLANMRIMDEVVPKYRKRLRGVEVFEQLVQVHDELMFEVPERMAEAFARDYKAVAERCPKAGFEHWYLPVAVKCVKLWKPAPEGLGP